MILPRALGDDRIEDESESETPPRLPGLQGLAAGPPAPTVRAAHPGTAVGLGRPHLRGAGGRAPVRRHDALSPRALGERARPSAASSGTTRGRASTVRRPGGPRRGDPETPDGRSCSRRSRDFCRARSRRRMERDFGAPALAMTVSSALPLFVVGFLGLFRNLLEVAGGTARLAGLGRSAEPDRHVSLRASRRSASRARSRAGNRWARSPSSSRTRPGRKPAAKVRKARRRPAATGASPDAKPSETSRD